jgi:outer membrane protein assembly factor BamB
MHGRGNCLLQVTLTVPLLFVVVPRGVTFASDWPQFRGPNRDSISSETGLLRSWPDEGPKVLWSLEVAQGYSAAAIYDGRVFFNDYDEGAGEWLVRSVDLQTGSELWRFREARRIRPNHGITRTVPAVDGKRVFSLDPKSVLHALDAATGEELWRKNLVEVYGTKIPPWYNGQCPLLDGDRLIIATGSEALMVALEPATGEEIWRAANPEGWPMSHSSVMPATLAGTRQYLYNNLFGTVGVAAATGRLLWHHPFKFNVAVAPSPLPLDGDRVLITAGYDAGGAILRVARNGDSWSVEEAVPLPPGLWNSEIHTPIFYDGHIFSVGRLKRGLLTCLDVEGRIVWTSEGESAFEMGSYLLADGMLFVLEGKTGMLRLVEASTEGYRELARAQVLAGHDVWGPPALSDGKLVIRDMTRMVCLDVAGGA